MKKRIYDLHRFDEGGAAAGQGGAAGAAAGSNSGQGAGTAAGSNPGTGAAGYSFAQAEEIANARAERAEKAALASYFKQQGLSEEQATEAIAAYKAAQAAKQPNVEALTKERDDARSELKAMKQAGSLKAKGVRDDDADYVLFKVRGLMAKDDKLTFDKAVDAFLKDNPKYTKQTYRVTDKPSGTKDGDKDGKGGTHANVNAAIRGALRRR